MGEQVLEYDPVTKKRRPPQPGSDALQNVGYVRHTDPAETARDFTRPHTIPADEYEAATGKDHAAACMEWDTAEAKRKQEERDAAAAAAAQ